MNNVTIWCTARCKRKRFCEKARCKQNPITYYNECCEDFVSLDDKEILTNAEKFEEVFGFDFNDLRFSYSAWGEKIYMEQPKKYEVKIRYRGEKTPCATIQVRAMSKDEARAEAEIRTGYRYRKGFCIFEIMELKGVKGANNGRKNGKKTAKA